MKGIAGAILVGGFFAATQGALAAGDFPLGAEALSYKSEPAVSSTYQSEHPVSAVAVSSDSPLGARELRERAEPPVRDTYQAEHQVSQTAVPGDLPLGARQLRERAEPPVRSTYRSEQAGGNSDSAD